MHQSVINNINIDVKSTQLMLAIVNDIPIDITDDILITVNYRNSYGDTAIYLAILRINDNTTINIYDLVKTLLLNSANIGLFGSHTPPQLLLGILYVISTFGRPYIQWTNNIHLSEKVIDGNMLHALIKWVRPENPRLHPIYVLLKYKQNTEDLKKAINSYDDMGQTPLMIALRTSKTITKQLLLAGADPELVDSNKHDSFWHSEHGPILFMYKWKVLLCHIKLPKSIMNDLLMVM